MNSTADNVAFREVSNLPQYELKLVNREKDTKEEEVMLAIENSTRTTYKMYAITSDGEPKAVVKSVEAAQSIVDEIKSGVKSEINLNLGVVEIYTDSNVVASIDEVKNTLNEIKSTKIATYEKEKKAAAQKLRIANRAKSAATTPTSVATGNLSGLALATPVNGTVSSRFGSRGASRSSIHTGLDICASTGTGIRAIAPGTVSYAGYRGTYGYLIIIDHGNGIESYYAHCNALYVGAGQSVDSNTTIAGVGSTGNSTGPHLHLEIRINDTPVNPQNYLY